MEQLPRKRLPERCIGVGFCLAQTDGGGMRPAQLEAGVQNSVQGTGGSCRERRGQLLESVCFGFEIAGSRGSVVEAGAHAALASLRVLIIVHTSSGRQSVINGTFLAPVRSELGRKS